MRVHDKLPVRKAAKLWKEFPYLWGIHQEWGPNNDVLVCRLDRFFLREQCLTTHRVFTHMRGAEEPYRTIGEILRHQDWLDCLDEVLIPHMLPLADALYKSRAMQLCAQRRNLAIDAVIVSKLRIVTIFKPPRECSIYDAVLAEHMYIHAHAGVKTGS